MYNGATQQLSNSATQQLSNSATQPNILLVLGGASVHCKLVEAAHELGVYVVVADYLQPEDSPAKRIADKHYLLDVNDVDGIVSMCRSEHVNAVLATHLDPCQRPYQKICERLGLPCLGTEKQFSLLTDKCAFKNICREYGVDTVPEFSLQDLEHDRVQYPVFIKPADSRGSRGQSVCFTQAQALSAVKSAQEESSSGSVIIEKYMHNADEIQVTYFFVNGRAYLLRTTDSYRGSENDNLERVVIYSLSPSKYTDEYLGNAHKNVVSMLKGIGIHNGPMMMQGFYDEGKFRFFDPGLRFPGVDYERIYTQVFGVDLLKILIEFAFTGIMPDIELDDNSVYLRDKRAAIFFPTIRAGTITTLEGSDAVRNDKAVVSYLARHSAGDKIGWTFDVNQRLSEIDLLADNDLEIEQAVSRIMSCCKVLDPDGNNMMYGIPGYPNIGKKRWGKIMFLSQKDLIAAGCFDMPGVIDVCRKTLLEYAEGSVIFPDKVSVIFDEATQERINCLPAGLKREKVYGAKWVSVFPENPRRYGAANLSAVMILSDLYTGFPIAFIEGTMCSNMRTAAMSALAAKYLAGDSPRTIGFIGAGEQAKAHFLGMKAVFPALSVCKVSSRTRVSEENFIAQMSRFYPDVEFAACNSSYQDAVTDADIIVTAISGQEKILRADWIKQGRVFYAHVGGLEDDFGVAMMADKIVCDDWSVVKHRTQTISRMYQQKLLSDSDIYGDLYEIVSGRKCGREEKDGLIYYNGVGLSYIDTAVAYWAYQKARAGGYGVELELQDKSMYDA